MLHSKAMLHLEAISVKEALDSMIGLKRVSVHNPLFNFISIYGSFSIPPRTIAEVVLFDHLNKTISQQLDHLRTIYELPVSSTKSNSYLANDFKTKNNLLQRWSLLYHRYILPEYGYELAGFVRQTGYAERSLRRLFASAYVHLTHVLLRYEMQQRAHEQKHLLHTRLPSLPYQSIHGRTELVQQLISHLQSKPIRPILLYGPLGVGKRTLAQMILHAWLENPQSNISNIGWLDQPSDDIEQLLEQIQLALKIPFYDDESLSLTEHLTYYLECVPTFLVLDNADTLLQNTAELANFLQVGNHASIVLCATYLPSNIRTTDMLVVRVPELDHASALAVYIEHHQQYALIEDLASLQAQFEAVYSQAGGNPQALKTGEWSPWITDVNQLSELHQFIQQVCQTVWNNGTQELHYVWLILTIVGAVPLASTLFEQIDPLHNILYLLDRSGLLLATENSIELITLAATFGSAILQNAEYHFLATDVIRYLLNQLTANPNLIWYVALIRAAHHARLSLPFKLDIAYAGCSAIERQGAWHLWHSYLSELLPITEGKHRWWVHTHLGLSLRWLGDNATATYHLMEAVNLAGEMGEFTGQADAMLELAILMRHTGHGIEAMPLLDNAYRKFDITPYRDRLQRVLGEKIQVLLDSHQLSAAEALLRNTELLVPSRRLSLTAHLKLKRGDYVRAIEDLQEAYNLLADDPVQQARLTTYMAQAYYMQGNWSDAVNAMTWAINVLYHAQDIISHARACVNMAEMYLAQADHLPPEQQAELRRTAASYLEAIPSKLLTR